MGCTNLWIGSTLEGDMSDSSGHQPTTGMPLRRDGGPAGGIEALANQLRMASWDIAQEAIETGMESGRLPSMEALGNIDRISNLPSFIGALATSLLRPRPNRSLGTNPIISRLAHDHVVAREQVGFSSREIVHEFLVLRRVMWRFLNRFADQLDARTVLQIEDRLNSVLDEVIAECTVIYFERATHTLSERSRKDSLTGLLNHEAFHTRLDRELDRCRRYGHVLHVIYLDLDRFKSLNDSHGHAAGDTALRAVAATVMDSIRDSDFAGRMGGDEFVIALVESSDLAAHLLVDRLRARLARLVDLGEVSTRIGISAGCAGFPTEADTAQDLLVLADARLYEDKRARKTVRPSAAPINAAPAPTRPAKSRDQQ